jgi:hypothetical protein
VIIGHALAAQQVKRSSAALQSVRNTSNGDCVHRFAL